MLRNAPMALQSIVSAFSEQFSEVIKREICIIKSFKAFLFNIYPNKRSSGPLKTIYGIFWTVLRAINKESCI